MLSAATAEMTEARETRADRAETRTATDVREASSQEMARTAAEPL